MISQDIFQHNVSVWLHQCFGVSVALNVEERNFRFFEEAIELVQACGMTKEQCQQLIDYTYGRPKGEITQEVGGVMVTLAALCHAWGELMEEAADQELERITQPGVMKKIRAKQANKPRGKGNPLP